MGLAKIIKEIFKTYKPLEDNKERVAGFICDFTIDGNDYKIDKLDSQYHKEEIRICFTVKNKSNYVIGFIIYNSDTKTFEIDNKTGDILYGIREITKEERAILGKGKEVLENEFKFVYSPQHETLAIKRKVENTISPLFKFKIAGKNYFVENIPVSSDQKIERIYYITDESGIVRAKIKFQNSKFQPLSCRENNENPNILKESLRFLKSKINEQT